MGGWVRGRWGWFWRRGRFRAMVKIGDKTTWFRRFLLNTSRLVRHLGQGPLALRKKFLPTVLGVIETAVRLSETRHSGEIRFVVESSLSAGRLLAGISPRERAIELFSVLGVWDTEENNGVLIYVLLADRDVEIVADRGLNKKIASHEWEEVCRIMESHFRLGNFEIGSLAGIEAVTGLLARHFPPGTHNPDELPNKPTLL